MEHIDVLPRIIEPSMMASFDPVGKKSNSIIEDVIPKQLCNEDNDVHLSNKCKEPSNVEQVSKKYDYLKQHLLIILVVISLMVLIYIFYKFYQYHTKSKDIKQNNTNNESKESKEIIENKETYKKELSKSQKEETINDATKYINLDNESDNDIASPKISSLNKSNIIELNNISSDLNNLVLYPSSKDNNKYDDDRFSYISSTASNKDIYIDINESKKRKKLDTKEELVEPSRDTITSIYVDPVDIERDIGAILQDINNEDIPNNPFMITDAIKSSQDNNNDNASLYSSNESTKSEHSTTTKKDTKKKVKSTSRRSSRVLKFRD